MLTNDQNNDTKTKASETSSNQEDTDGRTKMATSSGLSYQMYSDGREQNDWKSRYPPDAKEHIYKESKYVVGIFSLAFLLSVVFTTGIGARVLGAICPDKEIIDLVCIQLQYACLGLLGGITFSMSSLYRVVAQGYWHRDRKVWRFLSPWIASSIGFVIGFMVEADIFVDLTSETSVVVGAKRACIGFLAGYFADEAVGKMAEVANVLFGGVKKYRTNDSQGSGD